MKQQLLTFGLLDLLLVGCSTQKWLDRQIGPNSANKKLLDSTVYSLTKNAVAGANSEVGTLTRNLISKLKAYSDTLDPLDPLTSKIKRQVDSLGWLTNLQVDSIGLTVVNRAKELKREVTDKELAQFFVDAISQAGDKFNQKTRPLLANMIETALNTLQLSTTKAKLTTLVNNVLSDSTQRKLQQTINTALQPTLDSLTSRVDKIIRKYLPTVQKYVTQFLLGLDEILSSIIAWVWYQRRRYLRLVQVMTNQIHRIPNPAAYDELVGQIQQQAQ